MEKKKKSKQEKVIKLLSKQKIRDVKELDSYKLSVCHPACGGIDLGSAEIYVALPPSIAAYLGFVPHHKITGGVILSSKTDRIKSSAAQAFKKNVPSITQGKSALAAFYRRIAFRAGTGKAIIAVCRKLAIIFYNTMVKGVEYVEIGQEKYKEQQQEREKALLIKLAKKHNLELVTVS